MNPRQRVLLTLQHKEPDRVPLDSGGSSATGLLALSYSKLKRHLGMEVGTIPVHDVMQQLTMPEDWYLNQFEVDVVDVTREYCLKTSGWLDWSLGDGSKAKIPPWVLLERENGDWLYRDAEGDVLARMQEGQCFFDQVCWPLLGAEDGEYSHPELYLKKTMWGLPTPLMHLISEPDFPRMLGNTARRLHETTDYAIMLNAGVSLFETGQFLCRTDEFLVDLLVSRKKMEALLDRLLELNLEKLEVLLEAAGSSIEVIKINDDLGTQAGPMISPKLFRQMFKPRFKVMYDFIHHRKPGVRIMLHSCGSIFSLLPDLIDIGLDAINPVQTEAADMEPKRLKREFGKDLTFWGGAVAAQSILPWGTPQRVADDIKEKMAVFAPGGGFVFAHMPIMPEVPPENILAMFEAFARYR